MASVCNLPTAYSYRYEPTFKLDFQCSNPSAPSDARLNQPAVGQVPLTDDHLADLSEDGEISDSDDDGLPSFRKILAKLKQKEIIDLTVDDDDAGDDSDEEVDVTEVSGLRYQLNTSV